MLHQFVLGVNPFRNLIRLNNQPCPLLINVCDFKRVVFGWIRLAYLREVPLHPACVLRAFYLFHTIVNRNGTVPITALLE